MVDRRRARRLGRWDEAVDYFERSSTLNPRVVAGRYNAVQTLFWLRRYSRVRENAEKYLAKFPGHPGLSAYLAYARYEVDGDRQEWARAVEESPPGFLGSQRHPEPVPRQLHPGEPAAADRALSEVKGGLIPSNLHMIYNPVSLDRAMIAYLSGQSDERRRLFAENAWARAQAGTWNSNAVAVSQRETEVPVAWRGDWSLMQYVNNYNLKASGIGFVSSPYTSLWDRIGESLLLKTCRSSRRYTLLSRVSRLQSTSKLTWRFQTGSLWKAAQTPSEIFLRMD